MKKILIVLSLMVSALSCKEAAEKNVTYASFGKEITTDNALSGAEMKEQYEAMKTGDTINLKMKATVAEVCQAKGCWMKVDLEDGSQAMVKFTDYAFFMPKNIAGQEVVVDGVAYINEVSVQELRHYAEDANQSEDEIAAITEPRRTLSFQADGALVIEP